MFGRVKGQCESTLIDLSHKCPCLRPYSVRPAFVDAHLDTRVLEHVLQRPDQQTFLKKLLRNVFGPALRSTLFNQSSPTKDLGRFLNNLAGGDGKPLSEDGISGDG